MKQSPVNYPHGLVYRVTGELIVVQKQIEEQAAERKQANKTHHPCKLCHEPQIKTQK